ncbi:MAG TPA: helix-turn-helix domain-containing protein [Edaphobacter sp.]|nr:helix-turn-helix domain-containing protein [Edaphobacter sp.]
MLARLQLPSSLEGNVWRYANLANANRPHHHAELELNLVTHGKGIYLLGSRRYEIRRGDLLWLFPAQEHVLVEQTPDFAMWIAVFRRRAVKRGAVDAKTRPLLQRSIPGDACRRLTPHDLSRFEELFDELSSAAAEPGLMNAGLGYALLHAWKCFERAAEVPVRELHPAVERAARMIQTDSTDRSLKNLAHRAGLSASRLSRLFKEQTGSTLVDFRNRQRIERFQGLFGTGQRRTLLDAALEAGFGSYPQFHRVFRQVVGCSPKDYARRANT